MMPGVEQAVVAAVNETVHFLKGVAVGVAVAIPLGPIGFLCVRRTLVEGPRIGFVSGLGAATADLFFGFLAAFGVTFISNILTTHAFWLRLAGGLFLLYFAVTTYRHRPPARVDEDAINPSHLGAFASTFVLTLTNPLTIFSFAAIFTGLGLGASGQYVHALILVAGVFTGSALWWLGLALAAGLFHGRLHPDNLRWVNRVSGVIIGLLGLWALLGIWL